MLQPQEIPDLRVNLGFHEEAEAAETALNHQKNRGNSPRSLQQPIYQGP